MEEKEGNKKKKEEDKVASTTVGGAQSSGGPQRLERERGSDRIRLDWTGLDWVGLLKQWASLDGLLEMPN